MALLFPPIEITENGAAFEDEVQDGQVKDTQERTIKDSFKWYKNFVKGTEASSD